MPRSAVVRSPPYRSAALALGTLGLVAATARAETRASPAAETVADSSRDVSGVLVPEVAPPPSPARRLLVVPRAAVATVATPIRGGLTLYERYQVTERFLDIFFNDTRTFGSIRAPPIRRWRTAVRGKLQYRARVGGGASLAITRWP